MLTATATTEVEKQNQLQFLTDLLTKYIPLATMSQLSEASMDMEEEDFLEEAEEDDAHE